MTIDYEARGEQVVVTLKFDPNSSDDWEQVDRFAALHRTDERPKRRGRPPKEEPKTE